MASTLPIPSAPHPAQQRSAGPSPLPPTWYASGLQRKRVGRSERNTPEGGVAAKGRGVGEPTAPGWSAPPLRYPAPALHPACPSARPHAARLHLPSPQPQPHAPDSMASTLPPMYVSLSSRWPCGQAGRRCDLGREGVQHAGRVPAACCPTSPASPPQSRCAFPLLGGPSQHPNFNQPTLYIFSAALVCLLGATMPAWQRSGGGRRPVWPGAAYMQHTHTTCLQPRAGHALRATSPVPLCPTHHRPHRSPTWYACTMSSISHSVPDPLRSTSSGGMGITVASLCAGCGGVGGWEGRLWVFGVYGWLKRG